MKIRTLLSGLLVSAVTLTSSLCAAAPEAIEVEEAKRLLHEGERLFDAKDYARARIKFAAAYGVIPNIDILWNLAVSEVNSGRPVEGLQHLRKYVRDPKARAARKQEAESTLIPNAAQQTGHIEVNAPVGARLVVDGVTVDEPAPLAAPVDVAPGAHRIEAQLADKSDRVNATASAGETVRVTLLAASAASGVVPGTADSLAPPDTAHDRPAVGQGATRRTDDGAARPVQHTTGEYVLVGGLAAAGVASLVASALFGSASQSNRDDLFAGGASANHACDDPASAACAGSRSKNDDANRDRTLSVVTGIAGGAFLAGAAVTGVVLFALPKSQPSQGLWISPSVRSHSASVEAGFRF